MIQVEGDLEVQLVILGAVAAVTERIKLLTPARAESLDRLSRGRAIVDLPAGERWEVIPMPPDRESWASMMHEHEASGTAGVVVQWDERLIDLLRNPEPEDRSDLLMSTG